MVPNVQVLSALHSWLSGQDFVTLKALKVTINYRNWSSDDHSGLVPVLGSVFEDWINMTWGPGDCRPNFIYAYHSDGSDFEDLCERDYLSIMEYRPENDFSEDSE